MGIQFTIGHVGGGTKKVDVPSDAVDPALESLLKELYESDDEHYQGYVINSVGTALNITDSGLMTLHSGEDEPGPYYCYYYRPGTHAEAVSVLHAFVHMQRDVFLPLFTLKEPPPPGPGPNFLVVGMGEFALHTAAWSRNFTRVKALVEAGHDVNQRTPHGTTPLMGAVTEGHADMCRFLIEHGADVTVRLPAGFGIEDRSLLQQARKHGQSRRFPEIVEMLKQVGALE